MTFALDSIRYQPVGFWNLDSLSPYSDLSGYGRSGTASGAQAKAISLVTGAAYSTVYSSTTTGTFASPIFKQGYESQAFTIGAAFRNLVDSGEQQVLGNPSRYDGLLVDGNKIIFTTKYTNAGEARAEFELENKRAVIAYGVHTRDKNSLYVDGELVAEVNITPEQQADTWTATAANLSSGQTVGTGTIAVNAISLYSRALNGTEIEELSFSARDFDDDAGYQYGGVVYDLGLNSELLFEKKEWRDADDWNAGQLNNVSVEEDDLVSFSSNDAVYSGTWLDSFAMENVTTIYGVYLDWEGEDIIVQASLDGVNWEDAVRGKKLSLINEGFNATNKQIIIRVGFQAGVEGYLSSLTVYGMLTGTTSPLNDRPITYTGATPRYNKEALDLDDFTGVRLDGGSVTLGAFPGTGTWKTVEIWLKGDTQGSLSTNLSGVASTYSNGTTITNVPAEQWEVRTYVFTTSIPSTVSITGTGNIGRIVLYPEALTSAQVTEVYDLYVGRKFSRISDNSTVAVSEPATSVDIYARDWAISVAG